MKLNDLPRHLAAVTKHTLDLQEVLDAVDAGDYGEQPELAGWLDRIVKSMNAYADELVLTQRQDTDRTNVTPMALNIGRRSIRGGLGIVDIGLKSPIYCRVCPRKIHKGVTAPCRHKNAALLSGLTDARRHGQPSPRTWKLTLMAWSSRTWDTTSRLSGTSAHASKHRVSSRPAFASLARDKLWGASSPCRAVNGHIFPVAIIWVLRTRLPRGRMSLPHPMIRNGKCWTPSMPEFAWSVSRENPRPHNARQTLPLRAIHRLRFARGYQGRADAIRDFHRQHAGGN